MLRKLESRPHLRRRRRLRSHGVMANVEVGGYIASGRLEHSQQQLSYSVFAVRRFSVDMRGPVHVHR